MTIAQFHPALTLRMELQLHSRYAPSRGRQGQFTFSGTVSRNWVGATNVTEEGGGENLITHAVSYCNDPD